MPERRKTGADTDRLRGREMIRSKGKLIRKSNRRGMIGIAVVVLLLLVVLQIQSQKLIIRNEGYRDQKAELEQQIKDEKVRAGEIRDLQKYIDSDEYIEKIARDKLGLVYRDEIIRAEN